jgi:putative transposase
MAGSCRYIYNHALALQKTRYDEGNKKLSYTGLCAMLTQLKQEQETIWLNQAPSQSLQQSLKDLDRAYRNFFEKRAAFPQFKKRGIKDAFRYPQGCKLDQKRHQVFLPKIGWINYFHSQPVLGAIKNVTVSRKADSWYIAIQTEREVNDVVHKQSDIIGIDVGIAQFATLSNGQVYQSAHSLKTMLDSLKYQQRQFSRKIKFSQNWRKQKTKIAKLHHQIADTRLNHLHQVSNDISKNHAIIVLEALQIKNMSQSAAGKNVKAKSGLNRSILDQGWGEFRRQLQYKAKWLGGDVILVDPKYTSQTCPHCHNINKENRKTQSSFECLACSFTANADHVGALNILAAGHAVLACGEMVR